jgi:transcriptional regulator with PAS, ATPase and Fis domain
MPEPLLESELFGHKRGAFTGALADKPGLFEAADGATLFLDEVGETSAAMQVKLLRVLQEHEIRRVGETHSRPVDVRLVSATDRELGQEMRLKRFREDLYYRIAVFPIPVPALRERREDIPLLASRFLGRSNQRLGKRVSGISPEASELLLRHDWPGNVRELGNEIERAVALALDGQPIGPEHLTVKGTSRGSSLPPVTSSLRQARLSFEQEYTAEVLRRSGGNASKAAKVLGISRQMLQRKIKDYGLRLMIATPEAADECDARAGARRTPAL